MKPSFFLFRFSRHRQGNTDQKEQTSSVVSCCHKKTSRQICCCCAVFRRTWYAECIDTTFARTLRRTHVCTMPMDTYLVRSIISMLYIHACMVLYPLGRDTLITPLLHMLAKYYSFCCYIWWYGLSSCRTTLNGNIWCAWYTYQV